MLDQYYRLRRWSRDGVPLREQLTALGLQDVIETMESNGQRRGT
jgi:aldehyde:ferredoxin oxidoreductase